MILDTNALSAWAKNDAAFLRVMESAHELLLPVIVIGEYLSGVFRAPRRERDRLEDWLNEIAQSVELVAVGYATARAYGAITANLKAIGRPIPANDVWIAAMAVQHGMPVLSRDRHFDVVAGVERVAW